MEHTKKRRGSLLRNMFGASSSSTPASSLVSPNKKVRAEVGLTNTTLRMISSPDEPKQTFTVFQTRMLKLVDGEKAGNAVRYGPVEVPKCPIPSIRITKSDGCPFAWKEEGDCAAMEKSMAAMEIEMEIEKTVDSEEVCEVSHVEVSSTSRVPTPLPTPPESPVGDVVESEGTSSDHGRSRAGSLSRSRTIQSRKNSLSRVSSARLRNGILPELDTATVEDTRPLRRVHFEVPPDFKGSPSSTPPPLSPPLTPSSAPLPLQAHQSAAISYAPHTSSPARVQSIRRKAVPGTSSVSLNANAGSTPLNPAIPSNPPTSTLPYVPEEKIPAEITITPGSIIGGNIHPYFRRFDEELSSPPISPPNEHNRTDFDDASSVSSLDSFSSMSSFSTVSFSAPPSDAGNEISIVGTRDSVSTVRDSWVTYVSSDDEEARQREQEAQEARMKRMKEMARDLENRGGTLKWGGMTIGENDGKREGEGLLRFPGRKPVGVSF